MIFSDVFLLPFFCFVFYESKKLLFETSSIKNLMIISSNKINLWTFSFHPNWYDLQDPLGHFNITKWKNYAFCLIMWRTNRIPNFF